MGAEISKDASNLLWAGDTYPTVIKLSRRDDPTNYVEGRFIRSKQQEIFMVSESWSSRVSVTASERIWDLQHEPLWFDKLNMTNTSLTAALGTALISAC